MRARGLHHAFDVEHRGIDDARLHGRDAGDLGDLVAEPLRRPARHREHVGKALALVVGGARLVERLIGADAEHERHDARRHDERDGQHLGLEPPEVAQELAVENAHGLTT